MNNTFFNEYGYEPSKGWVGYKKQLNEQGMETDFHVDFGFGFKPGSTEPSPKPQPTEPKYLTFTACKSGASVGFIVFNDGYDIPKDYTKPSLQYSTDGGKTWQDYDLQISDITEDATAIKLAEEGASVMFKGVNETLTYYLEDDGDWLMVQAYIEGGVAASGDITSLLNGVGGDVALPQSCFMSMFYGCAELTQAPALPATTLANNCYEQMFHGCTSLTQAPVLPATTLAEYCYNSMFIGCTGLTTAPSLPATTLAEYCYSSMFYGCTGLTTAPSLPATTLANGCYGSMFQGCTAITSHDVATLNNSSSTFQNNTSCASLTIHKETPPTIAADTITGLPDDCIIRVPAASVDAYKAAQYWSARSAYIQAIE